MPKVTEEYIANKKKEIIDAAYQVCLALKGRNRDRRHAKTVRQKGFTALAEG